MIGLLLVLLPNSFTHANLYQFGAESKFIA